MDGCSGAIEKLFWFDAYASEEWNMEYLSDDVSFDDVTELGLEKGFHLSQQTPEALCALVSVRVWRRRWAHRRASFAVRGDNLAMLAMIAQFEGNSPAISKFA